MSEKRCPDDGEGAGPAAKMPRSEVNGTPDYDGHDTDEGASEAVEGSGVTPLPISHPFQARFRAPELEVGQYHVLDEAGSDGEDAGGGGVSDVDDDELMELLDADLPEKFQGSRRAKPEGQKDDEEEAVFEERTKTVLIEKGRSPIESLPEGWVQVTHLCGLPVFLHRLSRVVTVTRPYFLGPGSLRNHDIPLYAIPCLQYKRELERESANSASVKSPDSSSTSRCPATGATSPSASTNATAAPVPSDATPPPAASDTAAGTCDATAPAVSAPPESSDSAATTPVSGTEKAEAAREQVVTSSSPCPSVADSAEGDETAGTPAPSAPATDTEGASEPSGTTTPVTNGQAVAPVEGKAMLVKDPSVTPQDVTEYCKARFHFKTIRVMKFSTWRERRAFLRKKRNQRPQMSSDTKLLTFPVQPSRKTSIIDSSRPRVWVLNPYSKSYVCILHEYLQHVLHEQPVYSYTELESAATPYRASVTVKGILYGSGCGSGKKQAKAEAAKATLQIFIPRLMKEIDKEKAAEGTSKPGDDDLPFFDSIRLEDPRVNDLCSKAAEPSPYTILLNCIQRNFGMMVGAVSCKLHTSKSQHNEFEMTVGKHTARVPCKNKKDGKHLAAQCILQQLHPHLSSWGSLLRMYGNHSNKSLRLKRQNEQQVTSLQSRAVFNSPNYAILQKLRDEMQKLQEVQVQPIGVLHLSEVAPHLKTSGEAQPGPSQSGVTLDIVDV